MLAHSQELVWFNVRAMDSKAVERTFVVVDIENLCGGSHL